MTAAEIIEAIKGMSVLELNDLVKACEEEFGVSAAAGVVVAAAGAGAPAEEEKTEFDVELTEVPAASKIKVIKVVREVTGLGLKEAKELVEAAPKVVKEAAAKADAEELKKKLEEEFGVSAAAGVVVAAAGAGAPAEEEKTEFDVELTEVPAASKIKVIKVVREVTGLGLKEAKELVEAAPKVVKEAAAKADAEELKKKLEEVGAKVTLK